jgi:ABC-type dipeptide/oligopeptide/nickel transport system permease subunit
LTELSKAEEATTSGASRFNMPDWLIGLLRHKLSVFGLLIIFVSTFVALTASVIAPYDPLQQDYEKLLNPPSLQHWIGNDYLGRDVMSRLIHGTQISLTVGLLSVIIAAVIGVPLGVLAAFYGGWIDATIMRFIDAKMAIPGLMLSMLLLLTLGGSVMTVSFALGVGLSSAQSRLIRSQALSVKEREYFQAARAMGVSNFKLMFVHMLPNSIQPVIVQASLGVGFAILGEAGLSFLGLGVTPPTPTWGNMLSLAFDNLRSAPHLMYPPGIAIVLVVISFSFVGDGLRDVLDPRLRGKI